MKITNFEFGSVEIKREKATIQIPKTSFKYDSINELNEIQNERADFLKLASFKESENKERVVFEYVIPKDLKSLRKIKNEELIVKLSIAKTILERDPLGDSDLFTSIHPSTLFYRPMSTVKFTYQANSLMPNEKKFSNFERYKALVLSMISGLTYENCLNNKERILKAKNELLNAISATKTREELLIDLEEQLDYRQYKYFDESNKRKKRAKTRTIIVAATSFLLIFSAIGITKTLANKNIAETVTTYEKQIKVKDEELKTQKYLSKGEYVKAAESMKKSGVKDKGITAMFVNAGLYQEAIDYDPKSLEQVVQDLYKKEKKESILELVLADNRELEIEKKIVAYDYAALKNEVSFLENENQAVRMGKAFIERGDVEEARMLLDRFENEDLNGYLTLHGKEKELETTRAALDAVKKEIETEEDETKKKDLANQEKNHVDKIVALKKEVEELKK